MKKNVFISTGIVSVLLTTLNFIGTYKLCGSKGYGTCMEVVYDIMVILLPIIPLFIFSLITYKMREEVFESWWKFARIWIPLSMLAVLVSPSYGNWMIPIEKGTVAFASSILFVIISLVLIIWQSIKEKKKIS